MRAMYCFSYFPYILLHNRCDLCLISHSLDEQTLAIHLVHSRCIYFNVEAHENFIMPLSST